MLDFILHLIYIKERKRKIFEKVQITKQYPMVFPRKLLLQTLEILWK